MQIPAHFEAARNNDNQSMNAYDNVPPNYV